MRSGGPVAARLRETGARVTSWTDLSESQPIGVDRSVSVLRFEIPLEPPATSGAAGACVDVAFVLNALRYEVDYASVYGDVFHARWPPAD